MWVKADRAGLQILVRAVLPRSQDPRKGGPLTTLLAGSGYTQVGSWQQLQIDNLPQRIERQLRVLRTQFGPSVDAREAYIDQVVLNAYGGPGTTNVWIDDLELTGAVGGAAVSNTAPPAAAPNDANTGREPWPNPLANRSVPRRREPGHRHGRRFGLAGSRAARLAFAGWRQNVFPADHRTSGRTAGPLAGIRV